MPPSPETNELISNHGLILVELTPVKVLRIFWTGAMGDGAEPQGVVALALRRSSTDILYSQVFAHGPQVGGP